MPPSTECPRIHRAGYSRCTTIRGELVAALQAVATGAPDGVTRCVEAIGRCLEHLETCEALPVTIGVRR